jgi:Cof subfamily protein (haloacid dehalogenase superfamily)
MAKRIKLLLADVDGTLVTQDKALTTGAIRAVQQLHENGIHFAVTSGRPPRGMSMLIEPLDLQTPLAAFNGGLIVDREMSTLEQRVIPSELVGPIIEHIAASGLDVWVYRGADWFVRDPEAPHVAREAWTVGFEPTKVASYDDVAADVAKIVGVSDDHDRVARAAVAAHDAFGDQVSAARSQPNYQDVTHPQANKGGVVTYLSNRVKIPTSRHRGDGTPQAACLSLAGLPTGRGRWPRLRLANRRVRPATKRRRHIGHCHGDGLCRPSRRSTHFNVAR